MFVSTVTTRIIPLNSANFGRDDDSEAKPIILLRESCQARDMAIT